MIKLAYEIGQASYVKSRKMNVFVKYVIYTDQSIYSDSNLILNFCEGGLRDEKVG